jgi:hypothetical protein
VWQFVISVRTLPRLWLTSWGWARGENYHGCWRTRKSKAIDCCTDTHAFIVRTLQVQEASFCEKPLALDLKSIDDVMERVRKNGVKLQISYNRRFDKSFQRCEFVFK